MQLTHASDITKRKELYENAPQYLIKRKQNSVDTGDVDDADDGDDQPRFVINCKS